MQNPIHATMLGDYRFNDLLMDLSEEAYHNYCSKYANLVSSWMSLPSDLSFPPSKRSFISLSS